MERLAKDSSSFSIDERIDLHFALGKAYEDVGRYTEAFRQWLDGNALKRREIVYNEAVRLGVMDGARAEFTADLIRKWQNVGNPSPLPVFIVGMMRSGSTLVEVFCEPSASVRWWRIGAFSDGRTRTPNEDQRPVSLAGGALSLDW